MKRAALLLAPSVVSTLVLLCAAPALAQPPPPSSSGRLFGSDTTPSPGAELSGEVIVMRLAYTEAEGCPGEQALRDAIGLRVRRWTPFAPNAPWRLTVQITQAAGGYVGSVELRDVTGAVALKRAFPPTPRCDDLQGDLARAVGLRVDPTPLADPPQPSPSSQPLPAPPVPPQPGKPEQPAPPTPALVAFRVGMGTWLSFATAPKPAFGLTLDVGLRISPYFSIAAEGRWDAPSTGTVAAGVDVSSTLLLGGLVACGHAGYFAGCLVGSLGQIPGTLSAMGAVVPSQQTALYDAGGVRLGVEIPVVRSRLWVRIAASLLGGRPAVFTLAGAPQWATASVTGGVGAGLVASF